MEAKSAVKDRKDKKQIPKDKKERIITAGIKEFAEKGYALASTNRICQNAGISKGLLFHYFETKKQFYSYLGKYLLENITCLLNDIKNLKGTNFNNFVLNLFKIANDFWLNNLELNLFYERVKSDKIIDPLAEVNNQLKTTICSKLKVFPEIRKDIDIDLVYNILIGDITFWLKNNEILDKTLQNKETNEKIKILFEGIANK
ncbi:MAG: TetR/AcrR family transcriptional regulator [Candidatus Hodarchaeales archaeon]|jgi:AcrR family transcriptional regulator